MALIKGVPIVTEEWIYASICASGWLDPEMSSSSNSSGSDINNRFLHPRFQSISNDHMQIFEGTVSTRPRSCLCALKELLKTPIGGALTYPPSANISVLN
jgi:hypothetical protein